MGRQFTCDACGETYTSGWTEAEAEAEVAANFPEGIAPDDRAIVCTECYEEAMAAARLAGLLP